MIGSESRLPTNTRFFIAQFFFHFSPLFTVAHSTESTPESALDFGLPTSDSVLELLETSSLSFSSVPEEVGVVSLASMLALMFSFFEFLLFFRPPLQRALGPPPSLDFLPLFFPLSDD